MDTLTRPPHLKLQEMCDCYLETDFPRQLMAMAESTSTEFMEDGYKYLALSLLEATTEKAKQLSFEKGDEFAKVIVKSADREIELPAPSLEIMGAVMSIIRHILHIEENKGSSSLVLGLKSGQLDLVVNVKRDKQTERLEIDFPDLENETAVKKEQAATGAKDSLDICPQCGSTYWKCGGCKFTFTAASPPRKCPGCGEECDFRNITCYTPDCGGPGNIDPRLV